MDVKLFQRQSHHSKDTETLQIVFDVLQHCYLNAFNSIQN
jgi:hypothetical protein